MHNRLFFCPEINGHVRPCLSLWRPCRGKSEKTGAFDTTDMSLFLQPEFRSAIASTPGDLLLRLSDTCHPGVFTSFVLRRYLCPALDALPADQRANLFAILEEAERATVDVSLHFGRLDLSGEDSDGDHDVGSDDDDDEIVDPGKDTSVQFAERERRIEALIGANAIEKVSASEFDEEVLSWLPILWHLGVEGATNTGEILAALQLCNTIRYVTCRQQVPSSGSSRLYC